MKNKFNIQKDLEYVKTIYDFSNDDLATFLGISRMTLSRWKNGNVEPNLNTLNIIYNRIYQSGIRLNNLKEELYKSNEDKNNIILFHGAKNELIGRPTIKYSEDKKDFGKGFYLGENIKQAISFVSVYNNPSLYIFNFNHKNIKIKEFDISKEWMLLIAYFRGRIDKYKDSNIIKKLLKQIEDVDVIIAPIADNSMYEILQDFISGEITDEQCVASLSANRLGKQYVFRNDKVIKNNLKMIDKCFICDEEKNIMINERKKEYDTGKQKVKIAKRNFAGKGKYIEDLMV